MTILNKSVTAIGIFFVSCLVSLPNGFSQTSHAYRFLYSAGCFDGAHVDRQRGGFFQKEWT